MSVGHSGYSTETYERERTNLTHCELLRDSIKGAQISVADTVIADCTRREEVDSLLLDKALDFLAGNIERNDSEYAGHLQEDITRSLSQLKENLSRLNDLTREGRDSDDEADMFDDLFTDLWEQLKIDIESCIGRGSELRDAKNTPCIPLKERIESIFEEAESGDSFTFNEKTIREKYDEYGDTISVYPECLHILRTQLSSRMQKDMDDILDSVMTAMKDKFGFILGNTGKLSGKFGCEDHEILGRLIAHIKENNYAERGPTILHGLELLDGWRLSYRSFAQHRIREALNCLDRFDKSNQSQEVPHDAPGIMDMLKKFHGSLMIFRGQGYEHRQKYRVQVLHEDYF